MKIEIDKPVIPQFVADYLRRAKADITFMRVMELANTRNELPKWKKEYDWISANDETFARAWLYGYEVEEEPLYYAKMKGWELLDGDSNWVYLKNSKELILGEVTFRGAEIDVMTKEEWNGLGINDTNADFEEVEVWEVDISETYQNGGEN